MAALISIIAGPYSAVWNSADIGATKDGFDLVQTFSKESVIGDLYGDSVIDSVYRGGNCFLSCDSLGYAAGIAVRNPYGGTLGGMGLVGRMDVGSAIAKAMVLTAVAGTTAAATPATLTAANANIDENLSRGWKLASRAREVPLAMRLYPYDLGSSVPGWFSLT